MSPLTIEKRESRKGTPFTPQLQLPVVNSYNMAWIFCLLKITAVSIKKMCFMFPDSAFNNTGLLYAVKIARQKSFFNNRRPELVKTLHELQ